ncbi:hypothetical protein [Candidatus Puniceispirillum sp.]|uniref:hypothetical protein n=1 Tax=Candidatus Puniceispirillum sp. TaxID=2026719 RepID=UPI003F69DCD3
METQISTKTRPLDAEQFSVEREYGNFIVNIASSANSLKIKERSFFQYFLDSYSGPENIDLFKPKTGIEGRLQDADNIRVYFRKAIGHLNLR